MASRLISFLTILNVDIENIQKVHSIALDLDEIRVTFQQDVDVTLPKITIKGKRGDVLSIPRWVANVLEESELIQIQDMNIEKELTQAVGKENLQNEFELSTLEPNFYIKIKTFIKKIPGKDKEKIESLLNSLVRKRHGKIIHIADSSRLTAKIAAKLTVEEKIFYNNLYNISQEFTKFVIGDKK